MSHYPHILERQSGVTDVWATNHVSPPRRRSPSPSSAGGRRRAAARLPPTPDLTLRPHARLRLLLLSTPPPPCAGMPRTPPVLGCSHHSSAGGGGGGGGAAREEAAGDDASALRLPPRQRPRAPRAPPLSYPPLVSLRFDQMTCNGGQISLGSDGTVLDEFRFSGSSARRRRP